MCINKCTRQCHMLRDALMQLFYKITLQGCLLHVRATSEMHCSIWRIKHGACEQNREQGMFTCKVGSVGEEGVEWRRVPVFLFACETQASEEGIFPDRNSYQAVPYVCNLAHPVVLGSVEQPSIRPIKARQSLG